MNRQNTAKNITIPQNEYRRLRQFSAAYLKIVRDITEAERFYPYDYEYIEELKRRALFDLKRGRGIEAESVDAALAKTKSRPRKT